MSEPESPTGALPDAPEAPDASRERSHAEVKRDLADVIDAVAAANAGAIAKPITSKGDAGEAHEQGLQEANGEAHAEATGEANGEAHAEANGEAHAEANGEAHGEANGYVRAGHEDFWVQARGTFEKKDVTGYAPSPESDQLRVDVPVFEGPFDLLLHLIGKHAFDIFDIPIKQITEAYLAALDNMRALDLDVAGEFLVMASKLAHIKSRMLLPKEERSDEDDEDLGDPRVELVRRLLEYRRFKEVAEQLAELPILYRDVFFRLSPSPGFDVGGPIDELGLGLRPLGVMKLIESFDKILRRSKKKIVHEVIAERINVGARINELVDFAREREHFTFDDVVDRHGGRSRQNLIVTFLAVLEMTKLKLLRLHQADAESAIYLSPIRENLSGEWSDDLELSAGGEEPAVEPDLEKEETP